MKGSEPACDKFSIMLIEIDTFNQKDLRIIFFFALSGIYSVSSVKRFRAHEIELAQTSNMLKHKSVWCNNTLQAEASGSGVEKLIARYCRSNEPIRKLYVPCLSPPTFPVSAVTL